MKVAKLATLLALALCTQGSMAAEPTEAPEEIIVTGRLPGPPLWKVSNGDKVLWIFPYLEWIPEGMIWENDRVARVIAESQEFLELPAIDVHYPPTLTMNPVNVWRGTRLMNRLDRYPEGETLEQNLPPELFARYAALQASYFPREQQYAFMRPREVGARMGHIIREDEGLVSGREVLGAVQRLVRRNRDIERTAISVDINITDTYREYAGRLEALSESFTPEVEQACFEQQVTQMENIDEMKRLANGWAEGYIDEFRNNDLYNISLALGELPACDELITGGSSPEQQNMARTNATLNQNWLDAATDALATNASTFAVLPINELLAENALLGKLRAQGYEIREP